ncbi:ABC transporter ATP-binding protein [Halodesulfovibrio sp. MK-HDV]|jgi:heme exporter protein A|uniref:ABC transporter ATP-binding protein n=1 Tax=Halodesulfovibrio sp. MK-HDV TaxID=2599925 RepID=UPI00136FA144|nr:ABC transporter ATP-binding protein [Halodesulfovibrio sp. MK-HDV]KAF1074061.1 SkfA peptide export ATP-binding protein SkfE [Halodesulfovibrio sp. MK-HDV]
MLLKLDKVAKFYGNRLIIKDVSCTVEPGTVTILAGPNGAGKSTLLKIMAGLSEPTAGKVELTVENDSIGYVGHQTFIYPDLSALENLSFWSSLHGQKNDEETLLAALDRVELKRFAFERAGCFSRGMAQRLNLARVFLLQPSLILLDEPGTGLDVRSMVILYNEIAAAKDRGAGLVWISHSVAADLVRADKVLAIRDKKVEYFGEAQGYTPEAAC